MKMWICRNSEGDLELLFGNKPYKVTEKALSWWNNSFEYEPTELDSRLFPEVTFENSPMEVELVIKKQDERK